MILYKKWFLLAQFLGLFPAKGLWSAEYAEDIQFKKLSLQFLYSVFTLIIRIMILGVQQVSMHSWIDTQISSKVDGLVAIVGFSGTFCCGHYMQLLLLIKIRKFVDTFKLLERFDNIYRVTKSPKIWKPFLKCNLIFTIFTIIFVLTLVGNYALSPVTRANDNETIYLKTRLKSIMGDGRNYTIPLVCLFISIFVESATIFPIFKLSYLVSNLESRLQDTLAAILEYIEKRPERSQMELLLEAYTNGNWAEKKSFARKLGLVDNKIEDMRSYSGNIYGSRFWNYHCQKYLDFDGIFKSFLDFSGIHFLFIYPIQIISALCLFYLHIFGVTFQSVFISMALNTIATYGLVRLWVMSGVPQTLMETHERIRIQVLRVDITSILDSDERAQYERFVKIVNTVSVNLTVSGIFSISRGNIPAIITALVSYIIVIFQFRGSEVTKDTTQKHNLALDL